MTSTKGLVYGPATSGTGNRPGPERNDVTVGAISSCPQSATPVAVVVPARIRGTHADALAQHLAQRADARGEVAATLVALGDAIGTSRRQVRRSLRDLEEAGLLELVRPAQESGRYAPAVYRLTVEREQLVLPGMRATS